MVSPLSWLPGPCKTALMSKLSHNEISHKSVPLYCTWTTNLTSLPSMEKLKLYNLGTYFFMVLSSGLAEASQRKKIYLFLSYTLTSLIHFFIYSFYKYLHTDCVSDSILILGKACLPVVFNPSIERDSQQTEKSKHQMATISKEKKYQIQGIWGAGWVWGGKYIGPLGEALMGVPP